MSVNNAPARPTNGRPVRSSSAPGASPTNISRAAGLPSPKTVRDRDAASIGHLVHAATSAASAASAVGRSSVGTGAPSSCGSSNNEAVVVRTGGGGGGGGAGRTGGAATAG